MVLPAPGSPAMTLTERTGSPPPRISSKAALPVDRQGGVVARRSICLLRPPHEPAGAKLGNLLEPADEDGAGQLHQQPPDLVDERAEGERRPRLRLRRAGGWDQACGSV